MITRCRFAFRIICLLTWACTLVLAPSNSVADTFYTAGKDAASVAHKGVTVKSIDETQDGEVLRYTTTSGDTAATKLDDIVRIEIGTPGSSGEQTFNKAESEFQKNDLAGTIAWMGASTDYDKAKRDTDKDWVKQRSWLRQSSLVARMRPKGDPQGPFHFFIAFAVEYPEMAGAHRPPIPDDKKELALLIENMQANLEVGVFDRESDDTKRVVYPYLADICTKGGNTANARRFLAIVKSLPDAKQKDAAAGAAKESDDGMWAKAGDDTKSIVFVVSAQGSMINNMAATKDELLKAIRRLKPTQSFDIICFQDVKVEPFQTKMVAATVDNKAKAGMFLEGITATGTTDPVPAMKAALKLRPEVLYFVMPPGELVLPNALLDAAKQANAGRKTKINAVLLAENRAERDRNADAEKLMKQIAADSGGEFRWVEMDKLH